MTLFSQIPSFSFPSAGPAAAAAAALAAAALLLRADRRPTIARDRVRKRLGLPKGFARWLVIFGTAVIALLALDIDLHGLWSMVLAALSLVAIGFVAMWSILSHMLASVLIVVFRPFREGDRVEIVGDDAVLGEVTDLNPVYTTLRADDGGTLQIPNNLFFQKVLKRHAHRTLQVPATAREQ